MIIDGNTNEAILGRRLYYCLLLALIIAISCIYRLHELNRLSFWADELWGVIACSKGSWIAMIQDLVFNDNHPPGYQTILYFVMKWFGDSETMIRMPSIMAGIVTVYAVYHIGKKLFAADVAIISSLIVAGSYQMIYYSQEARAYSLLALFCLLNTYYFIKLFIFEEANNRNIFLFSGISIVCAYLHYAGLLFICCEILLLTLVLPFSKHKKIMLISAFYVFGIVAIAYSKWVPVMIGHILDKSFYWEITPESYSFYKTAKFLFGPDAPRTLAQLILFLLCGLILLKRIIKKKLRMSTEDKITFIIFGLIFLFIGIVLVKSLLSLSIFTDRYFIFAIPLASMICAQAIYSGLLHLRNKMHQKYALLLTLTLIVVVQFHYNKSLYTESFDKQDFRGAVKIIKDDSAFSSNTDAIIVSHEFFDYYLRKMEISEHAQGYLLFPRQLSNMMHYVAQRKLKDFYYLEVSTTEITAINQRLDASYHRIFFTHVNGINVIKYTTSNRYTTL